VPYTFLHPGFVLPLQRRFPRVFDGAALIMGSIAPDLDIIFRFSETRQHLFSYTPTNIIAVILPIAIILSFYMHIVMLPIATNGHPDWKLLRLKFLIRKAPSVVLSAGLAIVVHVLLDDWTHFSDVINKAQYWANDLGREPGDFHDIYLFFMYAPAVVGSAVGALLSIYLIWMNIEWLRGFSAYIRRNVYLWMRTFVLLSVAFALMKQIKAGIEEDLPFDSYIISITCGWTAAFLLTAPFYYLEQTFMRRVLQRLPVPPVWWYTFMPIVFGFYLIGHPQKEFLRIFIAKGVYLMLMAALAFLIIALLMNHYGTTRKRENDKYWTGLTLFVFPILTLAVPSAIWMKIMLLVQWILSLLLFANIFSSRFRRMLFYLSGGPVLFILAFYFSGKEGGPAIILLLTWSFFMWRRWTVTENESSGIRSLISVFIEMTALLVIILSRESPVGLILIPVILLTLIRKWGLSMSEWLRHCQVLYELWLPVVAILFIASTYSLAYGLLSACAYLIFFPDIFLRTWRYYFPNRKQ
jgi:hypothetical protein